MMSTLEKFWEVEAALRIASNDLASLSSALSRTGSTLLADELCEMADHLDAARIKLRDAVTAQVEQRVQETRQATNNMLGLACALLDHKNAK